MISRLRRLAGALLLVLVQVTAAAAANDRGVPIAKSLAVADIRMAVKRAEAIHPNLYWNTDRLRAVTRLEAMIAALPDPTPPMDVYLALSRFAGVLGDGHVAVSRPRGPGGDLLEAYLDHGGRLLMTGVLPTKGGLVVFASRAKGIAEKDIIRKINGQDALELFTQAKALQPGEPGLQRYFAALEFPALLWDLGIRAPFRIEGTFGGRPGRIEVAGITKAELDKLDPGEPESIVYEPLPGSIGLITFDRMTEEKEAFAARLEGIFKRVARERPRGLIIDLRANHGGDSSRGDALLDYISKKARRPFARVTIRASQECRTYYASEYADTFHAELFKHMADGETFSRAVEIEAPDPNPQRYAGPVAVLIGPGTFSSANILANTIQDFELATLVGRDTAEIASNYGMACPLTLTNAGIEMRVPSAYSVRANGDAKSREPVHPRIAVTRPEEGLPIEDMDMAAARRWLLEHIEPATAAAPQQARE
jgi:hypothetical protein